MFINIWLQFMMLFISPGLHLSPSFPAIFLPIKMPLLVPAKSQCWIIDQFPAWWLFCGFIVLMLLCVKIIPIGEEQ